MALLLLTATCPIPLSLGLIFEHIGCGISPCIDIAVFSATRCEPVFAGSNLDGLRSGIHDAEFGAIGSLFALLFPGI